MSTMATYYRVNLKDKQQHTIYPNVHNQWEFSSDGSVSIKNGNIKMKGNLLDLNGNMVYATLATAQTISGAKTFTNHLYLNGVKNSTAESTAKLVFGDSTTAYIVFRANTNRELVIGGSLNDNTNGVTYQYTVPAFCSSHNDEVSLGTASLRWHNLCCTYANFYNDVNRRIEVVDATLANNGITEEKYFPTTFNVIDKNSRIMNRLECIPRTNGNLETYWYVRSYKTDGTMVAQKGIKMKITKAGVLTYEISDAANFRSAITAVYKAGDVMSGNLTISRASGDTDTAFYAKRSDTGVQVWMGVGTGGVNHGIYSSKLNKWMMYGDASNVYLNGRATQATADASGNTITSTYTRLDGGNNYLVPTTSGDNQAGYRLLLQQTMKAWKNARMVLAISSRHQGNGILCVSFSSSDKISNYAAQLVYYGDTVQYQAPFVAYYNTSNGVFRLFYHYTDYSPCNIKILSRDGFDTISNGTWYATNLPSGIGSAVASYNNGANLCTCQDTNAKYIRATSISSWNSNYSGFSNGTVCFCW